jgi:Fe2+ transport system protein FeoA
MISFSRHFDSHRRRFRHRGGAKFESFRDGAQILTLADIPVGWQAKVAGFAPGLSPERNAHLQAYGLVPGYLVHVVRHSPVMVIRVEHLELALERGLARKVLVKDPSSFLRLDAG